MAGEYSALRQALGKWSRSCTPRAVSRWPDTPRVLRAILRRRGPCSHGDSPRKDFQKVFISAVLMSWWGLDLLLWAQVTSACRGEGNNQQAGGSKLSTLSSWVSLPTSTFHLGH